MNESALKDRLKSIAKNRGTTFNEVWKQLLLERFLARVSRSVYSEKFIFKGGLLLAQYIAIGRETTDIDFLMRKLKSELAAIDVAFRQIAAINADDGFKFEWRATEELTQPHMDYPGFRVTVDASLGKMSDKVQVDIGVGDSVDPIEETIQPFEYKGKPIFEGEITLLTYPVETIFSEKLETIISKGAINSRMKDYHDAILMIREDGLLKLTKLRGAVKMTFQNRGTALKLPIQFDAAGIITLQRLWTNHLNGLGRFRAKLHLPEKIGDAIQELNDWLRAQNFG